MKILAHDKGKGVDSYGKGEHRWNVNWLDFLEKEGHDVRKGRSNTRQSFDFYMDAPDICQTLAGRHQKHMHLNFSGCSLDLLNWPCYKNGELYVALPYRRGYERALKFWKDDNVVQPLFMPTCYPDYLLPKDRRPSWERPNITAALKDPFCKAYTDSRPAVADNVIWCLRAISKLADTEDFVFNIIQHNDMCIGHKDYTEEAGRIISSLPQRKQFNKTPWTQVVQMMNDSRFSVHPGTIAGSVLESIFTHSVPLQHVGAFLNPPAEITILGLLDKTCEEDWNEVLGMYWKDEEVHRRAHEFYQDIFIEHRSDSCRKAFKIAMEVMGLEHAL